MSSLPSLPHKLETLICDNNNLTCLPDLPSSLRYINCSYNNLIETNLERLLLTQHNQKRRDLGLPIVEEIVDDQNIRHRWMLLQYELDSDEYNKAAREIID